MLGDGSFAFAHSLIDELLQVPHIPVPLSTAHGQQAQQHAGTGVGAGLATGLRNRLGMLLNPGSAPQPQHHQQAPPPQYGPAGYSQQQQHAPQYQQAQQQQPQQQRAAPAKSYLDFTNEY